MSPPRYPELYARFRKLADIPAEEWLRLESLLRPRRLKKGELFIEAGGDARGFGIILSGLTRVYYTDSKGVEATRAFRGAFDVVGAFSELLLGGPSRVSVQALEDTELLAGNYDAFARLYPRHAAWQELGRKLAERLYITKEKREFEFLRLSATERYEAFCRENPGLAERVPQYHIASYLGITPVALSRIKRSA